MMRHKFLPFFDLAIIQVSFWICAVLLEEPVEILGPALIYGLAFCSVAFLFGLYDIAIRYAGVSLLKSAAIGSAGGFIIVISVYGSGEIGYFIFSGLTSIFGIVCSRVIVREYLYKSRHQNAANILVYGSGEAGIQFVTATMQGDTFNAVGYLDDNPKLTGSTIHGVSVYASGDLPKLMKKFKVRTVVLALPALTRARRTAIIEDLIKLPIRVLTVPSLKEIMAGQSRITDTQEVSVEDLLGRDPVPPRDDLLREKIDKKTILVTGAGGSIGAELSRQIACLNPRKIILLDNSEPSLYAIEQEMVTHAHFELATILGSVTDNHLIERLFTTENIQTVFHAAAYKHVPMVESNPLAALENNVRGTKIVLERAIRAQCDSFTFVSTDKAVRPTNIMGATKRIAEMLCQAKAKEPHQTTISMVRFGNVLGSSGSVIPTFRKQIAAGGPITVTHVDITRFFMTIPEASQLVIQSAALAQGGDVFLLDMGEPIKIYDLAKRLIRLSGKEIWTGASDTNSDNAIKIVFSGLRPGEKLYEELLVDAKARTTAHPKVMSASEPFVSQVELEKGVAALTQCYMDDNITQAKNIFVRLGTGYQPS